MKILVIGAGRMGSAAARDILKNKSTEKVILADSDFEKAKKVAELTKDPRLSTVQLDVKDAQAVQQQMHLVDTVLSAVTYKHNLGLARLALEVGVNFCDLGGNDAIVSEELNLDAKARRAGVTLIPDCGLAPGLVSIIAADGIASFTEVETVQIRVGGLPLHPTGPLRYGLVFSVEGLINEYVEPTRILKDEKLSLVESMTGIEAVTFPEPFGTMEAFYTSGGVSTLPLTFASKIRNLDYKTIRYPGHCERFKMMLDLGFARQEPISLSSSTVTPRVLFEYLLEKYLPPVTEDVVLVQVKFRGICDQKKRELTYQIIDRYNPAEKMTAMMRMTAFPASIIAQMLSLGKIDKKGAIPQELSVPPKIFFSELEKRGVAMTKTFS